MYLQYLLQEKSDSLLYKCFKAQSEHPVKGDWVEKIKKDIDEVNLDIPLDEIKVMSTEAYKQKVSSTVQ